jgi:putative restriction endonuclease
MPFVHRERELWDLRDATGEPLGSDVPERRRILLDPGANGRLTEEARRGRIPARPGSNRFARCRVRTHFPASAPPLPPIGYT